MKHFILTTILLTLIYAPKVWAQNNVNDCDGKYNCWLEKAHNALKLEKFVDAAYQYAAAQACDDAPIPDTLESWIAKAYKDNIQYIEQQKKDANALVKNAENQDVANNITGNFAQIMQNEDLTLQALLLHLACKKTQNTNKLAMRARREILSNPENRFYKWAKPINTEGFHKTVVSKDGSMIAQLNSAQLTINEPYKLLNVVLPPIIQAQFSPDNRYLFIQTQEKGNLRGETYIASKSVTQKHSFCIYKTDEMMLFQSLETTEPIAAAAFSQSSDSLIFVHTDGKITIRDLKNKINSSNGQIKLEEADDIDNLLMTNTGQRLLVGFTNGRISMYKNNGKEILKFPPFHNQSITTWDITEDDKLLITGSADSSMTLWTLKNKAVWFGNKKFNNAVTSVAFSPDGQFNITASLDKSITIKDKEGSVVMNPKGHNQGVLACGFSAFGNTFYSMDADRMKTWDFNVKNFDEEHYIEPMAETDELKDQNVLFSNDKKYFISQNTEGPPNNREVSLSIADAQKNELYRFDSTTVFDFSPNSTFFIIARHDSVFAWNLKKKELLWTIKSKMNVDLAYFSTNTFGNYFMLENLNEQKCELWKIPSSNTVPQLIFKDNISDLHFFADGSLFYFYNKEYKTEIRKTSEPRTVVAVLSESYVKMLYNDKDESLYALYPSEIEMKNKVKVKKYALFEINLKEVEKNKKLQPAMYFDIPLNSEMVCNFSEMGDSILFFKDKKIYAYPNTIKLLNEGKYLPKVLTNKIKRKNGIMTNDDCVGNGQLDDMMECSLFFAENVCVNTNALSQFEGMMKAMNVSKMSKIKIDTLELLVWQKFTQELTEIVALYPYETNYKEKIKMTKQIIEIRENIIGETQSRELGTQYGSLCWYNLFDDNADRFKKAMIYGEKALKMLDEDWAQANLGHAYLFNNDFKKAETKYMFFIDRLDELFKDFDILEKADITHPRMKEMKDNLVKLKNK
jgi:WD40 repeat protein